jgi:putative tryptophan/tyrosine transport system substrate-binding protein
MAHGTQRRLGVVYFAGKQAVDSVPYDPGPLASHGWILGRNLEKVRRFADGDAERFGPLARELVAARVDVLLGSGVPCVRAMQAATRTIPICAIVDDPVGNGFAKSLARPGGNITGLCEGYAESSEKEIELIRTMVPAISRIAIISTSRDVDFLRTNSQWLLKAAGAQGIGVDFHAPSSRAQFESILDGLPRGRSVVYLRWVNGEDTQAFARLAQPRRVPLVGQEEELVDHGALMTLRPNIAEPVQLAAMLARLLRGGNPAEIPFELPTKWVLAINRRVAAALGLRFGSDFAIRADKVVD